MFKKMFAKLILCIVLISVILNFNLSISPGRIGQITLNPNKAYAASVGYSEQRNAWIGKDGNLHRVYSTSNVAVYSLNSDGTTSNLLYTYPLYLCLNSKYNNPGTIYVIYNDLDTISLVYSFYQSQSGYMDSYILQYAKLKWNGMQYAVNTQTTLNYSSGSDNIQIFRQNCDYIRVYDKVYCRNGADISYRFSLVPYYSSTDGSGFYYFSFGNDNGIYYNYTAKSIYLGADVTNASGTINATYSNRAAWQTVSSIDNGQPGIPITLNFDVIGTVNTYYNGSATTNISGWPCYVGEGGYNELFVPKVPVNNTPSISILSPSQNQLFSDTSASTSPSISVSDADNDSLTCKYFVDTETTPRDTETASSGQTVTFNSFSPGSLTDGIHVLKFEVNDGKATSKKSVVIKVDKSVPAINNVSISSDDTSITMSGSAKDSVSGLDASPYNITIDSSGSGWIAAPSFIKNQLVPNTKYTAKFSAKDSVGHVASNSQSAYYTKAQVPLLYISKISLSAIELSISDNNPSYTQYQLMSGTSYVSSSGKLTTAPTWITLADKKITVSGLSSGIPYSFKIKAKSIAGIETICSSPISGTPN